VKREEERGTKVSRQVERIKRKAIQQKKYKLVEKAEVALEKLE